MSSKHILKSDPMLQKFYRMTFWGYYTGLRFFK